MVETGWLEAALKADRVMENMPYYYRQHCLSVKVLRKHMDRFLQPRKAVTEQIASSSLNIQPGGIPASEPREHNSVQERDSPPNDLSLQVTEFSKLLIAQIYKMNNFLVSTHLMHARTATRFMLMRQDAERRQKMIEPPFFEYSRVTSKELEEIRLATFRLYSDMYQLLFFSKINCEAIEMVLEEHDRRTGSDITSTFMNFVKTQDIVTYREEMITETELCRILAF
ncbi:unnamed protein product [Sphagnum troendelagicum]